MSKTVTQAAEFRNSIRKYSDQPVASETLREILRVAGLAPSPWNVQPWRVVVVQTPELKEKLMGAAYGQPQVGAAQAVFVVYSDMTDAIDNAVEYVHPGYGDGRQAEAEKQQAMFRSWDAEKLAAWGFAESNIFLGFLLLAVAEHGLASSAMLGFDAAKVKELLDLPDHATLPALVAVGYAAEEGFPHHRHEVDRFAKFV
jgi:nitroreductase